MPPPRPNDLPPWPATPWTDIAHASARDDEAARARALDRLCRAYDRPVLSCLRMIGFNATDAEDIRQRFFLEVVLGRNLFQRAQPSAGRFRHLLRRCLTRFAMNVRREAAARKRGGGICHTTDEFVLAQILATDEHPDEHFELEWAAGLAEKIWAQMAEGYATPKKAELWEAIRPNLARWCSAESQADAAKRLGKSATALSSELGRARLRFYHVLRQVVSKAALRPEDVEADLRKVLAFLIRSGESAAKQDSRSR